MRKIQKTISLEPMTSRMPSVWPAYMDNRLYFFDDESLKERGYLYPSNYGMIPMSVAVMPPPSTNLPPYNLHCDENTFIISFENLSKWYHFFKEYYHLLNDYGHCDRVYSSATEYYRYESGEKYADQMIYGVDKQIYEDLDTEFETKGGKVDIENISKGATDIGFYKWICDNIVPSYYISNEYVDYWKRKKLYYPDVIRWIAWFGARLNYEEFYTAATDTEIAHWNCKQENVDCCDCEEYFNRGGEREYTKMMEWYETLQTKITANNDFILEHRECFEPSIIGEIELQNSIEDLGQFSIFSKEYELGIDYRTVKTEVVSTITEGDEPQSIETEINFEDGNTNSGTVVNHDGEAMILQPDKSGFCFSKYYMDKVYDESAWSSYTDLYMKDNESEFLSTAFTYYAYDEYGKIHTGKTTGAVATSLESVKKCPIIETKSILINNTLFPIQESEYGIYDKDNKYIGGKEFFVYREKDTSTPYTLINGKKIYAELYTQTDEPFYYFTFFKNDEEEKKDAFCDIRETDINTKNYKHFPRKYNETDIEDTKKYIVYENVIYDVEDNGVTIDSLTYLPISGYSYDADNNIMYCVSATTYNKPIYGDTLEYVPKSKFRGKYVLIGTSIKNPIIYSTREVTGQTISRLSDLALTNTLVDDIGNKIDGRYNQIIFEGETSYNDDAAKYALIVNGVFVSLYDTHAKAEEAAPTSNFSIKKCSPAANHQPPQGKELELLYEVGNTSNIKRFSLTESANTATTNYFVGNIITDMVFYFKDVEGNIVEATKNSWNTSSLETIHRSQDARKLIEENPSSTVIFDGEDIYCDITYYIGATLKKTQDATQDTTFELAYNEIETSDNYNYGVEYKETVKFVKENREYHVRKQIKKQIPTKMNSVSAHSISYPIYVYNLVQEIAEIDTDSYNTLYRAPLATFKTEINLIGKDGNNLRTNYDKYLDMDNLNGIHVYPTFREEYMLGISTMENIDSDIYIERGINAAFEKHLKLGEVRTLEALLQYGNSYFKIMNN